MRKKSIRNAVGILLIAMFMLQGCVNIATSCASAVYNRHGLQRNFQDQVTTLRVNQALNVKTSEFSNTNISVATMGGEVLLAGQVPAAWQKEKAGMIVRNLPNVKTVYNLIIVSSPSSTLTHISDIWLTTKVKARLMASDDVDASQLKVVTENGSVYLFGTLPSEEAEAAAEIASETDGVQRVVKVFSYVTITKRSTV